MTQRSAYLSALLVVSLGLGCTRTDAVPTELRGLLVDSACYAKNKANAGMAHSHEGMGRICATTCAREGFPVWLVAADGKAYQIEGDLAANNNAKLVPRMANTVTVVGDIDEKGGQFVIKSADVKIVTE